MLGADNLKFEEIRLNDVQKFEFCRINNTQVRIFGYNENRYCLSRFYDSEIRSGSTVLFELPFDRQTDETIKELLVSYETNKVDALFYRLKERYNPSVVHVLFDLIKSKPRKILSIDPEIRSLTPGDELSFERNKGMFERVIENLSALDNEEEELPEINIVCGSYHSPCLEECLKSLTNLNKVKVELQEEELSEKHRIILQREIGLIKSSEHLW